MQVQQPDDFLDVVGVKKFLHVERHQVVADPAFVEHGGVERIKIPQGVVAEEVGRRQRPVGMREPRRTPQLSSEVRFGAGRLIEKYDVEILRRLQVEGVDQDVQELQRFDGINRDEQRQAHVIFPVIVGRPPTASELELRKVTLTLPEPKPNSLAFEVQLLPGPGIGRHFGEEALDRMLMVDHRASCCLARRSYGESIAPSK